MDLKEFTTSPKQQLLFHKITSSGLLFSLKTQRGGAIGFTPVPCEICVYWLVIERSLVKLVTETNGFSVGTRELVSSEKFVDFWITWQNDKMRLGQGSQTIAVWSNLPKLQKLQFVTFCVLNNSAQSNQGFECTWKCYLPSVIENLPLKRFKEGELRWVHADEQLPHGALIAGHEKEFLYIIRAPHKGSLTPGKFVPSLGRGFLPWKGKSLEIRKYEILVGYNCKWVTIYGDNIPVGAIEGGYTASHHETIFIGRALHKGHVIPGKVNPSHGCLYITHENKEESYSSYQILVVANEENRNIDTVYEPKDNIKYI